MPCSWRQVRPVTDPLVCEVMARTLSTNGTQRAEAVHIVPPAMSEQDLLGSRAYVAQHYGTFESPKEAYGILSGYINVDMGTGRLRGPSEFGPIAAAEVLEEILSPFEDLAMYGALPTGSRALGGSDYTSFNQAGLPGISMRQDPIRYFTHTWHTNLDNVEQVLEGDLEQAAVVVASMAYQLASRDELLPRFSKEEMPEPVE